MPRTLLYLSLAGLLSLGACQRSEVVPLPAQPVVVVSGQPGPPGQPGATGSTGNTGATGEMGKTGAPGKPASEPSN